MRALSKLPADNTKEAVQNARCRPIHMYGLLIIKLAIDVVLQVRALSKLPADRIEEAVQVPEPLQNADGAGAVKVWGEDALLDWPGAMGPGEGFTKPHRQLHCTAALCSAFEVVFEVACRHAQQQGHAVSSVANLCLGHVWVTPEDLLQ